MGVVLGSAAAYWLAMATADGSLVARFDTNGAVWIHVGAVALLLVVAAQGWPRFVGGFAPALGVGAIAAGVISQDAAAPSVNLLFPMVALGLACLVSTFSAMAWKHALSRGQRG